MPAIAAPLQRRTHIRPCSLFQLALLLLASSLPIMLTISPAFAHTSSSRPVSHIPAQYVIPNRSVCHYSGVSKDANGTYHFSWLHVDSSTGYIMDEHNCIVDLRGFNTAGTEFGDAISTLFGAGPQRLAWFNSQFKMNYLRLNLNVGWWNSNLYVPGAQMNYRSWIQQIITWAEQNGDYVLLNRTNEYQLPPCGGNVTYCPAQSEPSDVDDGNLQQQFNSGHLLDQTLAFWQSIVTLYRNDPAVLYNDWNELHDIDASSWLKVQTTLITTIRSINPHSLIMLGSNDWNNTMSPLTNGQEPDLTYPNLVYDWHIYDGKSGQVNGTPCAEPFNFMWASWGAESNREFTFAHQHGHGAIINEWGGCLNDPTYSAALSSYAASHHIGMAYYWAGNLVDNSWGVLNANGLLTQAAYTNTRFSN
jgi:hypothetical protein